MLGVYYYLRKEAPIPSLVWMPLVCMMAFIIFFMVGFGAVAWTVTAELLPASARGKIYPFIVAFSWVCNFVFGYSFTHIQAGIYNFHLAPSLSHPRGPPLQPQGWRKSKKGRMQVAFFPYFFLLKWG